MVETLQDIADAAYKYSRGRPQLLPSNTKLIADMLFSMVTQALFLVQVNTKPHAFCLFIMIPWIFSESSILLIYVTFQAMLVGLLPIAVFNSLLSMLHMCLLYSLYSFEYRWFNEGWELPKRLTYIENHWPYFVGFGMPLAVLTSLPSSALVRYFPSWDVLIP